MTTGPFLEESKAAPLRWMCCEFFHRFLRCSLFWTSPGCLCWEERRWSQEQCCVFLILPFADPSHPSVSQAPLCHCIFYVQWLYVQARQGTLGWLQGGATGLHRAAGVQPASATSRYFWFDFFIYIVLAFILVFLKIIFVIQNNFIEIILLQISKL